MSGDKDKILDKTHLGEFLLDCLKVHPDTIHQIDGYTGEEETNSSFLTRSVRLATCFRKLGLRPGDVIALNGPNHINVHVPYYAATYTGLPILGVDPTFKYDEILALFKISEPKIVFCQNETYENIRKVSEILNLNCKIIVFDGEYNMDCFLREYEDKDETVDSFRVTDLDTETSYCWLVSTSGTTGTPKLAAFTHAIITETLNYFKKFVIFMTPSSHKSLFNLSPLQWTSAFFNTAMTPLLNITRLQTSGPYTVEHIVEIINKYKPTSMICGAALVLQLLEYPGECDYSCFKMVTIGGSKVPTEKLRKFKERAICCEVYGQTETIGAPFTPDPNSPIGSCGKQDRRFQVKLVDQDTDEVIEEPNKIGQLYLKGPRFTEYYKNPEATAASFTKDGWYKSGDLLYRNEDGYYYFVERTKMLIKCNDYHILPPELENVIRQVEGVKDVVVVGIPHTEYGEVPVACLVRSPGSNVTAQNIKDIVANKLSYKKQLRGGVIFMDKFIYTSTDKIARHKIREYAQTAHRE